MPSGQYQVGETVEEFSCAPGPMGWRYHSDRADVVCDNRFRMLRVRLPAVAGEVVGARLADGTPVLRWPGAEGADERLVPADCLVTDSVGTWVAMLRAQAGPGEQALERAPVVSVDGGPAQTWMVRRAAAWQEVRGPQALLVEEWWVDVPASGTRELFLTGDVLLSGSALLGDSPVELARLDGPPSQLSDTTGRSA